MFYRYACLATLLALPLGCAEPTDALDRLDGVDAPRAIGSIRAALDACGETVPDTRKIDGVPAYAQCPTIENSAIYSNNGIDTSATKVGSDWVKTQFSGGYQCTELAHRYLTFKWKVTWIPNGNAGEWCNTPPPATSGVVQSTTPVHGDLIVFAPGSCGADTTFGHVAVVDVVDAAKGSVIAVEQNGARRGTYKTTCGKCFLHVVANDGTNPGETIGTGAVAPADAGNKLPAVVDAGVTPVSPKPVRDAAVDSGARPVAVDDEPEDDDQVSAETGKKADAGTRKDAGAKPKPADEDEEQPRDDSEDEESDPPASSKAAPAEGCSVGPGASGGTGTATLFVLLACLASAIVRRRQRAALAHVAQRPRSA